MSKKKNIKIAISLIIIGTSFFYSRVHIKDLFFEFKKIGLPTEISYNDIIPAGLETITTLSGPEKDDFVVINLAVPFSPQAPYADWSLPYLEACEETSALLVDSFYKDKKLSPEIVQKEILQLVDWQNKKFGYYKDTTAEETAQILREYFNYQRVDVVYDFSLDDIRDQISLGHPIIVPLAGRLLNNPFYEHPGPIYHTIVVKGLTKNGDFITNDVGTRRGHNYVYDANIFYDAIHDGPTNVNEIFDEELEQAIMSGKKAMIIVYPNQD